MFGTFAPEGPPACSGARESVVYGCALPLPTSSALQVLALQSRFIFPYCPQLAFLSADSARTLYATNRSDMDVWRVALHANRTRLPPTSAPSPPTPPSPCNRCTFSPSSRSPPHTNEPRCSCWCRSSQRLVACRRLCRVDFHHSFALRCPMLLLLYAQHHSWWFSALCA